MFCRNCGIEINEKAEFCVGCGCKPLSDNKFCQECGVETNAKQEICIKCGVKLKSSTSTSSTSSGISNDFNKIINGDGILNLDFSNLDSYYQAEFTKIYESNEAYKGKWNWFAFLFGGIWALTKGVWISPLAVFLLSIFTLGIPGIIYWIVCGFRGNYMYYNAYVKNKQLFF